MKAITNLKTTIFSIALLSLVAACNTSNDTDFEAQEKGKIGKIYDHEKQGVDIENRDNQFYVSRNDNKEGQGQETGAPTDTIDGDGDKGIVPQ